MLKRYILSICICLVLSTIIAFAIKGVSRFTSSSGYDYDSIIKKGYEWAGPKAGESINFDYLTDVNSKQLSEVSNRQLILLSVVDSESGSCRKARDQMRFLQENLKSLDVDYFIISFSQKSSNIELFKYVQSMNLTATTYSWTGGYENIIPSVNKMVLPSHILVDSKGKVIKSFPGTDNDKSVREKMTNQIIKEVNKEKSELNAKSPIF